MKNNNIVILVIIIIIIIILVILSSSSSSSSKEDFYSSYDFGNTPSYNFNYDYNYGTQCTNCRDKSLKSCKECVNCGVCYNYDNTGKLTGRCLTGDKTGPYFRPKSSCTIWDYARYPLTNASSNILWPPYNFGGAANWMREYKWGMPWNLDQDL